MVKSSIKNYIRQNWLGLSVICLTVLAFVLRLLCCFWGRPLTLHPDENTIVYWAMEMLERHSWAAHFYARPDHFEMKCNAILFTIFSWIKYGKPAYEAFEEHVFEFYFIARVFTSVFGTLLVPLTSLFAGALIKNSKFKYKKFVQLISAFLVAFSPIFVQHSAYATPDVVLAFVVILFSYLLLMYFESGSRKMLALSALCIGVGVTIKYPALILCAPLALIVIWKETFITKTPRNIIKYGLLSVFILLAGILVIAPNLYTDIDSVISAFVAEARPNHLGADNLGFIGNFKFYFDSAFESLGWICIIPFAAGLISLILNRVREFAFLGVGLIFWVSMSALSLHWLRWGIPFFPFIFIIVAIGIAWLFEVIHKFLSSRKTVLIILNSILVVFIALIMINTMVSGLCITKYSLLRSTLRVAESFIDDNSLTEENTLYEGYTTFDPPATKHGTILQSFTINEDGSVTLNVEIEDRLYLMMSDSYSNRYLREPDRYIAECTIYNAISSNYELLYSVEGDGNYACSGNIFENIRHSIEYLLTAYEAGGTTISIYKL